MKKTVGTSQFDNSQSFDHKKAAKKWIGKWEGEKIFEPDMGESLNPYYNLMMFPYPSAEGLHVGNMYAFSGADIYGRFMRMQGKDVFEPIGLDGFGIHSENYALKVGVHPADLAQKTEANFYRQLHAIGNSYDWGSKLETYDADYYSWTQWIFIQLFKAGLAYRATAEVNWCPNCLTVLADEQVIGQQLTVNSEELTQYVCERCGSVVKKRELTQWFFKITAYAQRLLDNLASLDWSEKVKIAQHNWLGKSEGASIVFTSDIDKDSLIEVFTTRPDTIFGVTYLALAVDHPLVIRILNKVESPLEQDIQTYLDNSNKIKIRGKSSEAMGEKKAKSENKTGVFTGFYATNPVSNKKVPIYVADYVLTGYGTGAVMGVPAHDQRDWEFANKYKIDIVEVIKPLGGTAKDQISKKAFTGVGKLINSEKFNGLDSEDAIKTIVKYIKEHKIGREAKMWHLRDWIISRQRYWGPPIPMIFCQVCADKNESWFTEKNKEPKVTTVSRKSKVLVDKLDWEHAGWYPVPEEQLPVELPYIEKFKPTGSGISPLAHDEGFVNVKCPGCGSGARRETDVSDTFLDSSWYFLRYPSVSGKDTGPVTTFPSTSAHSSNTSEDHKSNLELRADGNLSSRATRNPDNIPWDSEITKRWLPVDMYIGGAEHSVLHLLYARFITKVFCDLGLIDFEEPFLKFRAHGLLIKDGAKMSKSKGNVVNPDEYIEKFGVDTLRMYLMFCGRYDVGGDFRDTGIEGMNRFLGRIWRLVQGNLKFKIENLKLDGKARYMMHKTIKKVTGDITELSYNTAIAAMMEWMNFLEAKDAKVSEVSNVQKVSGEEIEVLLKLLAPFAPVMTEELWQLVNSSQLTVHSIGGKKTVNREPKAKRTINWSIHLQKWPKFDENLAMAVEIEIIVQVNGKLREKIKTERGIAKEKIEEIAKNKPQVIKYLNSREYKTIFVPDRIINFVVE